MKIDARDFRVKQGVVNLWKWPSLSGDMEAAAARSIVIRPGQELQRSQVNNRGLAKKDSPCCSPNQHSKVT